jgi:hypothetical protein
MDTLKMLNIAASSLSQSQEPIFSQSAQRSPRKATSRVQKKDLKNSFACFAP